MVAPAMPNFCAGVRRDSGLNQGRKSALCAELIWLEGRLVVIVSTHTRHATHCALPSLFLTKNHKVAHKS